MIESMLKIKNYKCIGEDFQGFDIIYPINIIIGRNNSGKSTFLDMIESFLSQDRKNDNNVYLYSKKLTATDISKGFRKGTSGGGLYFNNFGALEKKGAWEIEHSIPKSKGGTDHLNNLLPAHIDCNRSKSNHSTRSERAKYGRTRAPYSEKKAAEVRLENTFVGGGAGFLAGLLLRLTNPGLALITLIGSTIGYLTEPED